MIFIKGNWKVKRERERVSKNGREKWDLKRKYNWRSTNVCSVVTLHFFLFKLEKKLSDLNFSFFDVNLHPFGRDPIQYTNPTVLMDVTFGSRPNSSIEFIDERPRFKWIKIRMKNLINYSIILLNHENRFNHKSSDWINHVYSRFPRSSIGKEIDIRSLIETRTSFNLSRDRKSIGFIFGFEKCMW